MLAPKGALVSSQRCGQVKLLLLLHTMPQPTGEYGEYGEYSLSCVYLVLCLSLCDRQRFSGVL